MWGYVGSGDDLRLAFCHSSVVTMMRLSVSERPVSTLVEVETAVWSGPRIALPVGGIVASGDLPEGWQKTSDLDLGGSWDRIDIDLFDGESYVDSAILDRRDVDAGQWSLSPRPGVFAGATRCSEPFETEFAERDATRPELASAAPAEARAAAMPEYEFWAVISSAEGVDGTVSLDRLVDRLTLLSTVEIGAFHAQLMLQYFALDSARVWNESERQRRDSGAYETTTSEYFVWLRSTIILSGQEAVRAALAGTAFPAAERGEGLLDLPHVADSAFVAADRGTILPSITLKVGMGQNTDGW